MSSKTQEFLSEDCEDQGLRTTSECLKFECQTWDVNAVVRPRLMKRGGYWCCPRCGSSYGVDALPPAQRSPMKKGE
jgi:hypothetical protein